jgi:UDPglucose 6-dehydrogenase
MVDIKLGICGFGFVGQAVYSCINDNIEPFIYDPPLGFSDHEGLLTQDVLFCCLPTPTVNGMQDFSYYRGFFKSLKEYKGILVVKSTVLWRNIQPFFEKYNIVMNPEFLNERNSHLDFRRQRIIILGGRIDHCRKVIAAYTNNFEFETTPRFECCTAKEAIDLKYFHNVYHAYKVLYWNYVQELCGNERKIFDMYSKITGNTFEMAQLCADGKPGYGGSCFPKDVKAAHEGTPHELTEFMIKFNKRLRDNPNFILDNDV